MTKWVSKSLSYEGPTLVVYPEGVWYTYLDEADIDEIIDEHLVQGRPVARLRLPD